MSTLKVDAIRHNSATSDAITTAADGTCTAKITGMTGGGALSHRNKFINGAMTISQRATSFTDTGTAYTLDRMRHRVSGSFNFDTTTTQDSSAPDGFKKCLKVTPDSTQTPTGGLNGVFESALEGQDVQDFAHGTSSAKQMTVSFYAKSASQNNNHKYSFQIIKVNTGGSSSKFVLQPFTVTSSWQRFIFTFPGDTATAINDGNGNGLRIVWNLTSGPDDIIAATNTWTSGEYWRGVTGMNNFMDNTNNEFYLTGVQLEVGDTATSFEHRSFGEELLRCQRYCYADRGSEDYHAVAQGHFNGSGTGITMLYTPVNMRAAPTLAYPVGTWIVSGDSGTINPSNIYPTDNIGGVNAFQIRTAHSGGQSGEGFLLRTSSAGHTWILDAEL